MSTIDNTLNERGTRYGAFTGHAQVTQLLKRAMGQHPGWRKLQDDQREALEMTAHKIGRILNGDPNYIDSWHDIIGYVRLVEQRLEKEQAMEGPEQATEAPEQPSRPAAGEIDESLGAFISRFIREDSVPPATTRAQLSILAELRAMFPTADITVSFESEESGLTD